MLPIINFKLQGEELESVQGFIPPNHLECIFSSKANDNHWCAVTQYPRLFVAIEQGYSSVAPTQDEDFQKMFLYFQPNPSPVNK